MKSFAGEGIMEFMAKKLDVKINSVRQMFDFEETFNYKKGKLAIGIDSEDNPFSLNFNKSKRILVIAKTGEGKTFFMQNIISRFYASNKTKGETPCSVCIPTDIKAEYSHCMKPLQPDLRRFLMKYEMPMISGLPIKSYYPYFFTKIVTRNFPNDNFCQIALSDLNMYDFLTIAGLDHIKPIQRAILQEAFMLVSQREIVTFDELNNFIQNSDFPTNSKRLLSVIIKNIKADGVIGEQFERPTFVDDINNGLIPTLNLYGTLKASGSMNYYATAYVAVLLRKLYAAKAEGLIPENNHLLLILDEVNRFAPNSGNPSSKKAILELLKLGRTEKISMIFSAQEMADIPSDLKTESTLIFVPCNIQRSVLDELWKEYLRDDHWTQRSADIQSAKDESRKWDWMCINPKKDEPIIFRPFSPLCYHHHEK